MRNTTGVLVKSVIALFFFGFLAADPCLVSAQGVVDIEIADRDTGELVPARILFTKSLKKLSRPKKILFAGDQWLVEKGFQLAPPNGDYEFIVKRGPEFNEIVGGFTIEPRAKDSIPVTVPRSVDMHAEHWYSGDHLAHLPPDEMARWQQADAVDMVVSVQSEVKTNATKPAASSVKKRGDNVDLVSSSKTTGLGLGTACSNLMWKYGNVLLHGVQAPLNSSIQPNDPILRFDEATKQEGVLAELVRPWERDVPLLLASDAIRSMQILSSYNRPAGDDRLVWNKEPIEGVLGKVNLAQGKEKTSSDVFSPLDSDEIIRFKDARGVGKLSEAIYWQMLDAGLSITPTAGSGFSGNDSQVGYNRVYISAEQSPDRSTWWQAIRKGNTFVTNGPLLRANINGVPPGSVLTSYRSQSIPIDIAVSLAVRDPVDYLDVVFNGETLYSAKLEDHYKKGEFPPIDIDKSGWLVIRVVTEQTKGYRLATTAPFYFVFDGKPRISRKAVLFFQRWHQAAVDHIGQSPELLKSYGAWIERSKQFWESKVNAANAD